MRKGNTPLEKMTLEQALEIAERIQENYTKPTPGELASVRLAQAVNESRELIMAAVVKFYVDRNAAWQSLLRQFEMAASGAIPQQQKRSE